MSARRDLLCATCGPVTAHRIAMLAVLCPSCRVVVATCAGCGNMTLARESGGIAMRCGICGYHREMRPDEIAALATFESGPRRVKPVDVPQIRREEPRKDTFVAPPMPVFRKGAMVAAGPKPAAYRPPKERGAR